jgi:predicted 3-demethylubiquinone-9 3-methyltransferase (glyoxalase superfamily)
MPEMVTCLWFDGQAEQAAAHYTQVFPNSRVTAVTHAPAENPSGPAGSVLTVEFELDGRPFLGLNGGPGFAPSLATSTQVFCTDQEEVDHYWTRLSEGGSEGQCGWLEDRWGFSWQVVPTALPKLLGDPDPDRARRAMEAMMGMGKIVIAELEAAADGG